MTETTDQRGAEPARRLRGRLSPRRSASPVADLLAALCLAAIAALYFWRLDAWLVNDDEGSYLYAAWRISLGELPYADFLTPQLPAFLMPGGWLQSLTGPEVWPSRALAVLLTLGAGIAVWLTGRRLYGSWVGVTAGALFLLHPDVYLECRTFRPEPFMLVFATWSVYAFVRGALGDEGGTGEGGGGRRRMWLAVAGALTGLALLSKLFGVLPLAGCGAWLVVDSWRRGRPLRELALDVTALFVPFAVLVAGVLGAFSLVSTEVFTAVLGHHLRQGAQLSMDEVVRKGLAFYATYLRHNSNALMVFVALAVAFYAWRANERRVAVIGWQIPTLLVFLVLSRELWPRHLVYGVPALATLYASGVGMVLEALGARPGGMRRWLAAALVGALVVPWVLVDRDIGWRWEDGTWRIGRFIAGVTEPNDIVLSDYSELNFYGRRPTTYSGASLSAGAASSGQITWQRIHGELEEGGRQPALLVIDRTLVAGQEYGHLRFLQDLGDFESWVRDNYELAGTFLRHPHEYRVYRPSDEPLPVRCRFDGGPTLISGRVERDALPPGEKLPITTLWHSGEGIDSELVTTLRLVDRTGVEWSQADEALRASRMRSTDDWVPNELNADRFTVTAPYGTPAGYYDVVLGLYRRADVSLLEARDAAGASLGRVIAVGRVRVGPTRVSRAVVEKLPLDVAYHETLAPGLELIGRGPLPSEAVEAGGVVDLDLWWAVSGPGRSVRVDLTPLGAAQSSVTARAPLAAPDYGPPADKAGEPTVVWQQMRLPIPAAIPGGSMRVTVTPEGAEPAGLPIGEIEIVARDLADLVLEPPPVDIASDASFGDIAELVGATVAGNAAPDSPLEVGLVWRALSPTLTRYKVSVQLLDESGEIVAQSDGEPAQWRRPTTSWVPGEIVVDRHALTPSRELSAGTYFVVAAMYEPRTSQRLSVTLGGPAEDRGSAGEDRFAVEGDLALITKLELPR